jgi:hypothetical protein
LVYPFSLYAGGKIDEENFLCKLDSINVDCIDVVCNDVDSIDVDNNAGK